MFPELGQFALILALCLALVQGTLPLAGAARNQPRLMAVGRPAAYGQFLFLLIALSLLTYAFLDNDFSVLYVAQHSNSMLPWYYRFSAVWGGHEGSLLLWITMLGGWSAAVALLSKRLPAEMVARVLAIMGLVSVGFLLFILITSNPFERLFPVPMDGRDLNPLLQDIGLILHPPTLYMGYVGFTVAFAFAMAALLGGRLDAAWARWSRPWTIIAWMFLTLGISLGSWWAYYELGWGGWWFWDPVENASFLPWLAGTALLHSLAVSEKRGAFKNWTVLLAILTFSLTLLGAFLVRSGVLTSVHAFASDPARGLFILMLLGVVVGASLLLYAWRAPQIKSTGHFALFSRETLLLGNNVILLVVTASVLLGTLYPLILDALGLGKISVGEPYFNAVFVPLSVPLMILLGFGALVRWKRDEPTRLVRLLRYSLATSLVLGLSIPWMLFDSFAPLAMLGVGLAVWITGGIVIDVLRRVHHRQGWWHGLRAQSRSFWGMSLAHLGVAVTMVGIALTTHYSMDRDIRMVPGQTAELGDYAFYFADIREDKGPNYSTMKAVIQVTRNGSDVTTLKTEKRFYKVTQMPMTEVGLQAGLLRDLYVAIGEPLDNDAWAMRIYVKPFVRWIWLGSLFMAFGGILAASDRRYRLARHTGTSGESAS